MYSKHNHQHHKPNQSDLVIKVDWNKKMLDVPKQLRILGVEGDQNARSFPFEILRAPTDIDFTTGIVKVVYVNANGDADEHVIDKAYLDVDENTIRFDFVVPPKLTAKSGRVKVGISIIDINYEWRVSPTEFYVVKYGDFSTPVETLPEYDLLNQILLKQTFLEKYINDENDVDLDGLLEIFNIEKLGLVYSEELPLQEDAKYSTIYVIPEFDDQDNLLGYHSFVWNGNNYILIAQTPKLSAQEFEEEEIEEMLSLS